MYAAGVHFYRASPHVTRAPRQKGLIKVNFPLIVTNNWIQTDVIVSKTRRGIKNAVRAEAGRRTLMDHIRGKLLN
jgi:hypothetical protein